MNTVFHRLGPYEVISEIGRGGMALVVLATDTRTGQNVALKLVQHADGGEARAILEAEQSGAELQRQFSQVDRHVPAVYEHLANESGYFLVAMEYLDGENLSDLIARGPLPVERAVSIALELCAFLEAAHHFEAVIGDRKLRSLVHGDLKPQNVRITSSGAVKVLDFGIAKALSLSRKVTRNDYGTTPYLSPERLDGDVNEFADLWAVGVMLYEMVRGMRPFDAPDTRRLERLIRAHIPPLPLAGRCSVGLEAIITKLLGPTVAARYEHARAIREDLERFTSGARTTAEEQGWPARPDDPEATRRTKPTSTEDEEATRRTRPTVERKADAPSSPPVKSAPPARLAPPSPSASSGQAVPRTLSAGSRPGRGRKTLLLMASIVLILGLVSNECSVRDEARKVVAAVSTQELDELGEAWAAHENLSERSHLGWGTWRLERSLIQRTLALTDRVIANYRMALPTVREAQWQSARDALARAIPLARDDLRLRAAFRLCDGHLHRINGEARKQRHEDAEAQRELTEAVASFREAADLRTDWPDPFLGLARTFIYGLEDVDRGADALDQAQRRGYTSTDRERGQMADGYLARGNSLVRNARELSGMPQEVDYLARAIEDYERALALFTEASSLATGPMNIRVTQRALDQAQWRLDVLMPVSDEPATPEPPPLDPDRDGPLDPARGRPEDSAAPRPESQPSGSARREDLAPWP
ncbi:MAG TPA: protein kinase [Vicinamibacterales bacterium]|nr:protein kinase [Vicinamibacterales bacterium]